jgi:hypothetical protein
LRLLTGLSLPPGSFGGIHNPTRPSSQSQTTTLQTEQHPLKIDLPAKVSFTARFHHIRGLQAPLPPSSLFGRESDQTFISHKTPTGLHKILKNNNLQSGEFELDPRLGKLAPTNPAAFAATARECHGPRSHAPLVFQI